MNRKNYLPHFGESFLTKRVNIMDTTETIDTMIKLSKTKAGLIAAGLFGAGAATVAIVGWSRNRKAKNTDETAEQETAQAA